MEEPQTTGIESQIEEVPSHMECELERVSQRYPNSSTMHELEAERTHAKAKASRLKEATATYGSSRQTVLEYHQAKVTYFCLEARLAGIKGEGNNAEMYLSQAEAYQWMLTHIDHADNQRN